MRIEAFGQLLTGRQPAGWLLELFIVTLLNTFY